MWPTSCPTALPCGLNSPLPRKQTQAKEELKYAPPTIQNSKKRRDEGTEYILEFNRDSVRLAEKSGFKFGSAAEMPMTATYDLFYYAFLMHSPLVSREFTEKIIDGWGGINNLPDGLMQRLIALYIVPFNTVLDDDVKNPKATIVL